MRGEVGKIRERCKSLLPQYLKNITVLHCTDQVIKGRRGTDLSMQQQHEQPHFSIMYSIKPSAFYIYTALYYITTFTHGHIPKT